MRKIITLLAIVCMGSSAICQHAWNTTAKFSGKEHIAHFESSINAINSDFTVEFWVNPAEDSSYYTILGKGQFRIMTENGRIRVQTSNNTKGYSTSVLPKNKWTHVAIVFYLSQSNLNVYINGSLNVGLAIGTTLPPTSDSLLIGKSSYADNFQGELDEIRIWSTARSSSQIQYFMHTHLSWYNYTNNAPCCLLFAETFDFDVYSPGFYLPHGGAVGNIGGTVTGILPSTYLKHNSSLYVDGTSYVTTSSANNPDVSLSGNMTVEAWIYLTSIGTVQTIMDLSNSGSGGYKLYVDATGSLMWQMNNVGGTTTKLQPNKWYHVAVACETPSSTLTQVCRIYLNGKYSAGYNYNQLIANTGKLVIGQGCIGFIDEVRISNFTKTPEEILKGLHVPILYANKPVAPQSTVAYNFDGAMYSGTRTGPTLLNSGARFSREIEPSSPLFYLGNNHTAQFDSIQTRTSFKAIPSAAGTAGYTYDTIQIAKNVHVSEIKAFLSVTHDALNTLKVELIAPNQQAVTLMDQEYGGSRMKDVTTLFDGKSTTSVSQSDLIDFSPRIKPHSPFTPFLGQSSKGNWILKITDLVNGGIGTLYSWGLSINGGLVTSLDAESNLAENFAIYPNPSNSVFHFELKEMATGGVLNVYDLYGRNIYSSNVKDKITNLDLSGKQEGVYLVEYVNGNTKNQQKVIVSK